MIALLLLFGCLVGALVGYAIGKPKGQEAVGLLLGLLLGILGWVIVALMPPNASVADRADPEPAALVRSCPWCAEPIRIEARVCRFCGRDVEALATTAEAELERVRRCYPDAFVQALPLCEQLPVAPERPADWLTELCRRIEAGSPPAVAAERIPLDWAEPAVPTLMTAVPPSVVAGGTSTTGADHVAIQAQFPREYPTAAALLAARDEPPARPDLWLRELCTRMAAGSPAELAAERIPLTWGT